jgi:hypothetical protein
MQYSVLKSPLFQTRRVFSFHGLISDVFTFKWFRQDLPRNIHLDWVPCQSIRDLKLVNSLIMCKSIEWSLSDWLVSNRKRNCLLCSNKFPLSRTMNSSRDSEKKLIWPHRKQSFLCGKLKKPFEEWNEARKTMAANTPSAFPNPLSPIFTQSTQAPCLHLKPPVPHWLPIPSIFNRVTWPEPDCEPRISNQRICIYQEWV